MSENAEFAKRIIKMRIKYVLERSQGQILDEKKLRNIAIKVKQGESQPDITKEIQKLAFSGIEKVKPLLKDVIKQLLDEYIQTIKDITDEAIVELVNSEIQKIIKE
jgi:hypothetical protein